MIAPFSTIKIPFLTLQKTADAALPIVVLAAHKRHRH
jgi:hypothetical protein